MKPIDLRSDTVTIPTTQMRETMANAAVGDDVYGEDPTINRLQEIAAGMMGKQSGLFIPSGTMGNLIAVLAHCARGDEVIMGDRGHTFLHEAGGISALGGVFAHVLPNQADGTLHLEDIQDAIRSEDIHEPPSRLLILENTQNRCGGVVLSVEYTSSAARVAHEHGIKVHIDGARIFNAAVALERPVSDLVNDADSVTFCLSKGLCAPVGSVLCGTFEFIARANRLRKVLGGGMRQAGIVGAAGIVALETMVTRLAEDHQRAKRLAEGLQSIPGLEFEFGMPQTNMVFVTLNHEISLTPGEVVEYLSAENILIGIAGGRQMRLVTHAWIDDAGVDQTIQAFRKVLAHAN